jgi:hypothetical protein
VLEKDIYHPTTPYENYPSAATSNSFTANKRRTLSATGLLA